MTRLSVLAVALVILLVPVAEARAVECGQVLTEDTTLDGDLDCTDPSEPGLVIGAPGITVDLGGFAISTNDEGIVNTGHDDVTIRNGTITAENGVIRLIGAERNLIRDITARGLLTGIHLSNSDFNRIVANDVSGVFLTLADGSDSNVVRDNVVTRYESGIGVRDSSDNRVVDNVVWTEEDMPISLVRAHRNVVRRNTLISTFTYGYPLLRLVASNRNEIAHNGGITYGANPASGIELEGSNRNVLHDNRLDGTPLGVWVRSGTGNQLLRNTAKGTTVWGQLQGQPNGFDVATAAQRTTLIGNVATGFAEDGFRIFGARSEVGSNTASDNGAWGIQAIPGTTDLGGNQAAGNGRPEQCLNIVCS